MSNTAVLEPTAANRVDARRSLLLVFSCTLIGAVAQMLIKAGSGQLAVGHVTLGDVAHHPALIFRYGFGIISNVKLFFGYCLYGINLFLMAMALKGRELSKLYPIIALSYVWVTFLSLYFLGEHMNPYRAGGIALIVGGVSILGIKVTTQKPQTETPL